jgi:heat shock protein HslJ
MNNEIPGSQWWKQIKTVRSMPKQIRNSQFAVQNSRSAIRTSLLLALLVAIFPVITSAELTLANAQSASELNGTSWQLVKLQAADESMHVPDDKSKYTITFGRDGRVTTRVDCNRASSTWKSPGAGKLQFGSWSRTSAKCGPRSLHDRIVTEGANVRSYVIKDGHLFLSGMAAGGWYELEPTPKRR